MDIIDGATQGNEGDALLCMDRKPPGCSLPLTAGKRHRIHHLGTEIKSNSDQNIEILFEIYNIQFSLGKLLSNCSRFVALSTYLALGHVLKHFSPVC